MNRGSRTLGRIMFPIVRRREIEADGRGSLSDHERVDNGVGSWIERRARFAPDHVALIAGGRPLTYAALATRIRQLATGLRGLGVGRGDRVAWLGPNHAAFLETLFAVGRLGAILAPVNDRLTADDRAHVLADTEPILVVEHGQAEPTRHPSSVRAVVGVGPAAAPGAIDYESLLGTSAEDDVGAEVRPDDVFMLPHTSGTTGRPKGVMLTHGNVTWNAINFISSVDYRAEDVTVAIAPFFRVGGTGVNVLPLLFRGGTVVIPEQPGPDGILDALERHRVTIGFGNPDSLADLRRTPRWASADLSALRFIITGGAPVPEPLIRAYQARGISLLQGYGLSEAAPFVLLLDADHALAKAGSAGRPPLFVDVRVVDGTGRDVPSGVTGELACRGPNVMTGYWRLPADTAAVLTPDGWLRTGDAARMDADGFVWIVDRVSARFMSDGHEVYPGDVERVLLEHAGVADVGVTWSDERIVALVVPVNGSEPTEDELLAFARAGLASHQAPDAIRFVEALPRNSVGKLIRGELSRLAVGPASEARR